MARGGAAAIELDEKMRPDGQLTEAEIHFAPADETVPRDAAEEVFPGCPLTFHLAEALRQPTLVLERAVLQPVDHAKPPSTDVAEKLWQAQKAGAARWKIETPFKAAWHFSLLVLARCEIQAIDQHWSLHRLVLSLPDGGRDESLAANLHFCELAAEPPEPISWPTFKAEAWQQWLRGALAEEIEADLAAIRQRQDNYLRRELARIDDYFESYERELTTRFNRQSSGQTRIKTDERLAAAKTEHERRRVDQVQRHEIRIIPHLDALVLLAEPAWKTSLSLLHRNEVQRQDALFVPRARRWVEI